MNFRAPLLALALSFAVYPAAADDAVLNRWYSALLAADRDGLSELLADDARIKLIDLGVEQSKQEFLASMDEWREAVERATIRHRIETTQGAVTTVTACYDFPGNDVLMRETFSISGSAISENTQEALAENCDSY